MKQTLLVAFDVIREAFARRMLQSVFLLIVLWLFTLLFALNLDAAKGMVTAVKLFGQDLRFDSSVDANDASQQVNLVAHYFVFHMGIVVSIILSSSIATQLLAPGRVEFLLALPIRRWQLLIGTFLGVLAIVALGFVLAIAGTAFCLYIQTGFFPTGPAYSISIALLCFATIYAAMLLATVFVRSTVVATCIGFATYFLGLISSARDEIVAAIDNRIVALVIETLFAGAPRFAELANYAENSSESFPVAAVGITFMFAVICVSLAQIRFSGKDY